MKYYSKIHCYFPKKENLAVFQDINFLLQQQIIINHHEQ